MPEHSAAVVIIFRNAEYLQSAVDAAGLCIDLVEQFAVGVVFGVHIAEERIFNTPMYGIRSFGTFFVSNSKLK